MVSREKINELVSTFYQSRFKIFYINSKDEKEFCKPEEAFVSLGMTTSKEQMENITNAINLCDKYSAKIVEISSKKKDGLYLNTVLRENPEQYKASLENISENNVFLNKQEVDSRIEDLKTQVEKGTTAMEIENYGKQLRRLSYVSLQLDESNGWNSHVIQKIGDDYRIYHLLVNYKVDSGVEYRIGILINERGS